MTKATIIFRLSAESACALYLYLEDNFSTAETLAKDVKNSSAKVFEVKALPSINFSGYITTFTLSRFMGRQQFCSR